MKAAREALNLTQARFCEQYGYKLRTYQKNEGGDSEAGICLAAAFVQAGINSNWILTGEGAMLLADSQSVREVPERINTGALAALLRGAIAVVEGGMSVDRAAKMAADMYDQARVAGEITPTGIGEGSAGKAA